jgi:adenylate kinase family enzyme
VPEFAIWAQLGEHAATRTAVSETGQEVMGGIEGLDAALQGINANVVAGLNANRDALNRITALLSAVTGGTGTVPEASAGDPTLAGMSGLRHALNQANVGILDDKIIPADRERYPAGLKIPQVSEIYINPRYRVAEFDDQARPADERWWDERESRDDFDIFLARHATSPDATRRPLLLLGHPGAGKSLLTKVLAARLSMPEYTVVRVSLRRVSADAEIHHQIEEALDIDTHQQIAWSELAEQSRDTARVVLLDGLDELLQASEHDRSRYLEDVMDFQEREAMQLRPVVVIVTSRIVVADRVRIPDDTTIVKLDPFNDDDIANWLERWKRVNANTIAAGAMGELTHTVVRRQPELAEQPLLLLMLALYASDPDLPALSEEMATAELYRRLLDGFAVREAGKDVGLGHDPSPDELEQRARDHLDRLAIAALGMFNRGRQDIGEEELSKDLEALRPRLMAWPRPAEAGQRIIGEFFFVHAPEARTIAARHGRGEQPHRAYEFLHATFAEYLVARRVMDELVDVTVKAFSGRRPTEPDDDTLFALLSHQILASRRSMLDFASEIFVDLPHEVQTQVLVTLEALISMYRNRHDSNQYAAYRPVPPDQVRQLACYSANLVALRVLLEQQRAGVPLSKMLYVPDDPSLVREEWRVTPLLWKSGLDTDGLSAMLTLLEVVGSPPRLRINKRDLSLIPFEISLARLVGDKVTEKRLRFGTAINDEVIYYADGDSWPDMMSSWLISAIAGTGGVPEFLPAPPEGTPHEAIIKIAELIFKYLRSTPYNETCYKRVLELLFKMPAVFQIDELALTAAAIGRPDLRESVPNLQNFSIYGHYSQIVRMAGRTDHRSLAGLSEIKNWQNPSSETLAALLAVLGKPLDLRKE